jgi:hypothetical protein
MEELEELGIEKSDITKGLSEKARATLDGLSEVELFFVVQELFKLGWRVREDMYSHIKFLLQSKFGVSISKTDPYRWDKRFDKWIAFWQEWQSKLTIRDMQRIIDCIDLKQPYTDMLPVLRWNQRKPQPPRNIGHQG